MAGETIIEEGEGMKIPNIEKEDDRLSLFEKLHEIAELHQNQYEEDCIGIVEQFVNLHLKEESYTSFEADAILEVMNILSKMNSL
jgi:hypothetical protein